MGRGTQGSILKEARVVEHEPAGTNSSHMACVTAFKPSGVIAVGVSCERWRSVTGRGKRGQQGPTLFQS